MNSRKQMFIPFLIVACALVACIDRNSPGFKKISKEAQIRKTMAAKEILKTNEDLRELNEVCSNLPIISTADVQVMSVSKDEQALFYYYDLDFDFDEVASRLKTKMPPIGWNLVKENNGLWERQIEFVNEDSKAQFVWIRHAKENAFSTSCERRTRNE